MKNDGLSKLVWTLLLLSHHPSFVSSLIPGIQDEVIINEETRECTLKQVRECATCFLRNGWKSIGLQSRGVECPSGYTQIESSSDSSFCIASRSNFCCSSVVVGSGECDNLAFNQDKEKCSITLCEELPDGWSRDVPDESFDGLCPYEPIGSSWVDSNELGCDDPCHDKTSCSACINADCKWSFVDNTCQAACEDASTCLGMPIDEDVGINAAELCVETKEIVRDNLKCEEKDNCNDCLDVTNSGCRWVDTCGNQDGVVCGKCFATSCGGTCDEIEDCSAPVPTSTSTTEKVTTTTTEKVPSPSACKTDSGKCVTTNGHNGCCVKGSCKTHSFWLRLCRRPKKRYGKKHRRKRLFGYPSKYGKRKYGQREGFLVSRSLKEDKVGQYKRSLRH